MDINTIWQPEKNSSGARAKSARSGPQNPGNPSFAGKILWSRIAKIAELTPARSTDTTGNFRWSGRDTTRSAANDPKRTQEHFTMSEFQPILVPINQASAIIGKCRRGIYQLIATDQLKAVKSGRSTLVVYESLKQYAANLPVAKFRAHVKGDAPSRSSVSAFSVRPRHSQLGVWKWPDHWSRAIALACACDHVMRAASTCYFLAARNRSETRREAHFSEGKDKPS